jgi:hypothetical protein
MEKKKKKMQEKNYHNNQIFYQFFSHSACVDMLLFICPNSTDEQMKTILFVCAHPE